MPATINKVLFIGDKETFAQLKVLFNRAFPRASFVRRDTTDKGLMAISSGSFDVCILSHLKSNISGISDLTAICNQAPATAIIFISDRFSKRLFQKVQQCGASDFLVLNDLTSSIFKHSLTRALNLKLKTCYADELSHRHNALMSIVDEGVLEINLNGIITFANKHACKLLEMKRSELLGQHVGKIYHLTYHNESVDWINHPIMTQAVKGYHYHDRRGVFVKNDGESFFVAVTSAPLFQAREDNRILIAFKNITEKIEKEEELLFLAQHDALTGLPNRYHLTTLLPRILAKAERNEQNVALLFIDFDRFKNINDTLGHDIGDELLVQIGNRLHETLRKSDTIIRLGGDEFMVLLEGKITANRAAYAAKRINEIMRTPFNVHQHTINTACSVGIALFPSCAQSADELVKCADIAMYSAKKEGGGTYTFYTLEFNRQVSERMILESQFRSAIDNEELTIRYEPRVCLKTEAFIGCEAVLSWISPEIGHVKPYIFMPIAEEIGLTKQLNHWTLENCCRQIHQWNKSDIGCIPVSMNISVRQLMAADFVPFVASLFHRYNIKPGMLTFELLESNIMHHPEDYVATLTALHKLGVVIMLDHFGTGASYLGFLKCLPIDLIKIDRSFIKDIITNPNNAIIVKALIQLSHNLGIKVVAEDIENKDQYDFLRRNGCDQGEGKYFGYSLENSVFAEFVGIRRQFEKQGIILEKWQCLVCDYIYHEEQGDGANNISPGTLWKQVPGNWHCPDCQGIKSDFRKVEIA